MGIDQIPNFKTIYRITIENCVLELTWFWGQLYYWYYHGKRISCEMDLRKLFVRKKFLQKFSIFWHSIRRKKMRKFFFIKFCVYSCFAKTKRKFWCVKLSHNFCKINFCEEMFNISRKICEGNDTIFQEKNLYRFQNRTLGGLHLFCLYLQVGLLTVFEIDL